MNMPAADSIAGGRGARSARRLSSDGRARAAMVVLVALAAGVGCASPPPYRQPPDFEQRFERVRTITLVPPKVAVYKMSAGDTEEEVLDWSDAAYGHVIEAVKAEVEELGRVFVPYEGEVLSHRSIRMDRDDVAGAAEDGFSPADDSWLLFEAANLAIMRHAYDPWNTFPEKVSHFDYTLGREARTLIGDTPADAFLLIIATDHVPTRERSTLVAAGLLAGALTASYAGPGATPAKLTLALVEVQTGDLLWFNTLSLPFTDLRDEATDQALVDTVMKGLER